MPIKSEAQGRLMEAAARTAGGYGGVPQSVGKKFVAGDEASASAAPVMNASKVQAIADAADRLMKRVDSFFKEPPRDSDGKFTTRRELKTEPDK